METEKSQSVASVLSRLKKGFIWLVSFSWLIPIVIVLLAIGFGFILVGTDQGRDLLRLAQDKGKVVYLFSSLAVVMIFIVILCSEILRGTPKSDGLLTPVSDRFERWVAL